MNDNIINLREPYTNRTMNMVRKHIIELKKNVKDNSEAIDMFEGTLRSFYKEAIEAGSQELAA